MKTIAKIILTLSPVFLLGADGPGAAKTPRADQPKDTATPPMSRKEAIRELMAAGYDVEPACPGPGRVISGTSYPQARKSLALLPLVADAVELNLSVNTADDADLAYLKRLTSLKRLTLDSQRIKGDGLRYIEDMKRLRHLDVSRTNLGDESLKHIALLSTLETLGLGSRVTERNLAQLEPLQGLKVLYLPCGIGDEGLKHLRHFKGLEGFGTLTRVSAAGLRDLGTITTLKNLDLGSVKPPVDDAGMAQLAELYDLERLNLVGTSVTDASLAYVGKFHMLNYLSLGGLHVTDTGLAKIEALRRLQDLWLADTRITDAGMCHIAKLPNITALHLDRDGITDAGLAAIKGAPNLRNLFMRGTAVTDAGMAYIETMPQLKWLDVMDTGVTGERAKAIRGRRADLLVYAGRTEKPRKRSKGEREREFLKVNH